MQWKCSCWTDPEDSLLSLRQSRGSWATIHHTMGELLRSMHGICN